jgi:hypothetical protein
MKLAIVDNWGDGIEAGLGNGDGHGFGEVLNSGYGDGISSGNGFGKGDYGEEDGEGYTNGYSFDGNNWELPNEKYLYSEA